MKRLVLVLLLVLFLAGCAGSQAALRTMCEVQHLALQKYVAIANMAIEDSGLTEDQKAYFTETGRKLVRNQETILKLLQKH